MMSRSSDHILLVEGEADRAFFEQICRVLGLNTRVYVAPPRDFAGSHNTKEGVFNSLPTLLDQLADGRITCLAMVVDADNAVNGGGYESAIKRVEKIVAPYGFVLAIHPGSGIVFQNNDGLADFGLWVMPNNADDGMLEDWIKQSIHPSEQGLFAHAEAVVAALPKPPKFKAIHRSKAEVATWLAWQKQPGHGIYRAVEDGLIDIVGTHYQNLAALLGHVYCSPQC
ncbi:MAG: DUF3226 domain-containing protein [Candidatus Ozemobacteraceae bacterium]